ncbi:MAG: hypothetical protein ACI86S_001863 [Paracoccaceae bacterium]|jgi:hypothetical protein
MLRDEQNKGRAMNADRIISMILRRLMNTGINKGINLAANRGRDPNDMTDEERTQAKQARDNAKRGRKAMQMGRRIGRF